MIRKVRVIKLYMLPSYQAEDIWFIFVPMLHSAQMAMKKGTSTGCTHAAGGMAHVRSAQNCHSGSFFILVMR